MMSIELTNSNLAKHIEVFHGLDFRPSFSISDDTDLHILFFKRKDKYYGIRTGEKEHFESRTEFLVNSFLVEEIRAHIKKKLVLENLTAVDCANSELRNIYSKAKKIQEHLPSMDDVVSSHTILNDSDLNWVFLESEKKYHSLFWNESESKLFSRCA